MYSDAINPNKIEKSMLNMTNISFMKKKKIYIEQ